MRLPAFAIALSLLLAPALIQPQAPQEDPSLARMHGLLNEARELQSTQLTAARQKLEQLLDELRPLQQAAVLSPEQALIYESALILRISLQTKLLEPETGILQSFRELLALNPLVGAEFFNPRERLLLEKVLSTETGRLALQTTPPGMKVSHMGRDLGTTPATIAMIAGPYTLRIQGEGYLAEDLEVVIQPAEIVVAERTMRRKAVEIPVSLSAPEVNIFQDGRLLGQSRSYTEWISSLPQTPLRTLVGGWGADKRSASFFRLPEVPVGKSVTLEFRATCYEPVKVTVTVDEQGVDWSRPALVHPELRLVSLVRDTGFMEISSDRSEAVVWIDGKLAGRTPLSTEVCSGTRRIQVIHPAGQYVREVILRRGQAVRITGELKPALAFFGVYTPDRPGGSMSAVDSESLSVARYLALRVSAFTNLQMAAEEIEFLRQNGQIPVAVLLAAGGSSPATLDQVKAAAAAASQANMLLLGQRAGDRFLFRLYSTLHATPDLIELPDLGEPSLDFLVHQLNRAVQAGRRLHTAFLDFELVEVPAGLVVMRSRPGAPPSGASVAPGSIIRAVDQKRMNFRELQAYLQTRDPGLPVNLEVVSGEGRPIVAPVPVRRAGAEYPWSSPDGFPNAVLQVLHHLSEREPDSEEARLARLAVGRGLMQRREWRLALEVLTGVRMPPEQRGIGAGTLAYYIGRSHEALGEHVAARASYTRAMTFPSSTIGTFDGLPAAEMAERRREALRH